MVSGFITVRRKKHNFVIEDNKLILLPRSIHDKYDLFHMLFDNKQLGRDIIRKIFKGITSEGKLIYILSDDNYCIKDGVISHNVYAYTILRKDISEIRGMLIYSKELEYFYKVSRDIEKTDIVHEDEKRGTIKFESRDFKNDKSVNEFSFSDKKDSYRTLFSFYHNISINDIYPVRIIPTLSIGFEKNKTMQDLIDIIYDIKNFLKFITYRNDVSFDKIELRIKNTNGLHENVGYLVMLDNNIPIEDKKTLESIINFDNIKPIIPKLFTELIKDGIILNHIPFNFSEKNKINYSRYLVICSSFEAEFRKNYGNNYKYKNKKDFKLVRDNIIRNINKYINDLTGKKRQYAKNILGITKKLDISLEEALNIAFNDNLVILEPFIKHYFINVINIKYDKKNINNMCSSIAKTRNDFAHANMNMNYNKLSFLCLKLVEFLIYSMTLKRLGLDSNNIKHIINDLFKMNILLDK